ncbi:MAG: galactose-1-phosphate uridylyltransferase [bacterium]|nr:galactose-1-phosphate uridylyltransferase [bacterium]
MPELRKDILTGAWVVVSPERSDRPQYLQDMGKKLSTEQCPFCEGNEAMTPPEVYAQREAGSEVDGPGWTLRVIPNKYPALRSEGELSDNKNDLFHSVNGIGEHEVVIETLSHTKGMDELSLEEVFTIFSVFRRRILDLKKDGRIKFIQVFKNHGRKAGATIPHPHSQIVAMPVVPARVEGKLKTAETYYHEKKRCVFCDIIREERENRHRVLVENDGFVVFSPFAARLPFEMVIYPKKHAAFFEENNDSDLELLVSVFRETIGRMNRALGKPAYNLVLHTAPVHLKESEREYFHWHLEIVPVISGTGGFELGTHTYINPTSPEEAIKLLSNPAGV